MTYLPELWGNSELIFKRDKKRKEGLFIRYPVPSLHPRPSGSPQCLRRRPDCQDVRISLLSTSSAVHDRPIWFWHISRPLTATPPAFAALAGPRETLFSRNRSMASRVVGMLAPSTTATTPPSMSMRASSLLISFWVAHGMATSTWISFAIFQGFSPS